MASLLARDAIASDVLLLTSAEDIIQLIRDLCEPWSVANSVSSSPSSAAAASSSSSTASSSRRAHRTSAVGDDSASADITEPSPAQRIASHFTNKVDNSCLSLLIASLVARLRLLKCPHTRVLPPHAMRTWDAQFAHVLLFSLFREHPAIAWKRLLLALMLQDLDDTEPFDGSEGPVSKLFQACLEMPTQAIALERCVVAAKSELVLDGSIFAPFRTPTPLILLDTIGGFTLLHCLAAQQCPLERQTSGAGLHIATTLTKAGIRINEADDHGRTALHVAASVLNLDMVMGLVNAGASLSVCDAKGCTPLFTLASALAMKQWRESASGEMIVQALLALTGHDFSIYWHCTPSEVLGLEETPQSYRRGLEGNLLVKLAHSGDETVLRGLINRVKVMTTSASWSAPVLRFLLIRCIRKGLEQGVESVWNAFERVFAVTGDDGEDDKIDFLHHALSAATAAGRWFVLSFLVRKLSLLRPSLEKRVVQGGVWASKDGPDKKAANQKTQTDEPGWEDVSVVSPQNSSLRSLLCLSPFLHIALLRGDPNLLDLLLFGEGLLPSHLLSPCASTTSNVQATSWLPFLSPALLRASQTFSPLELACLRGDEGSIHKIFSFLSNYSFTGAKRGTLAAANSSLTPLKTFLTARLCHKSAANPLVCCVIHPHPRCLEMFLEYMGAEEFAKAAILPDKVHGLSALPALLHAVAQQRRQAARKVLQVPVGASAFGSLGAKTGDDLSSPLGRIVTRPGDLLQCLDILLDALPLINLDSGVIDAILHNTTSHSCHTIWDARRASLQTRLSAINTRINAICRSPVSPPHAIFTNAHVAAHLTSLLDADYRRAFLHRAARSMETWDGLEDSIQSSAFVSNMRALNYLWRPEPTSAWGRVIQCVVFILTSHAGGVEASGVTQMLSATESWRSLKRRLGGSGDNAQTFQNRTTIVARLKTLRTQLLEYKHPFLSGLATGRSERRVHVVSEACWRQCRQIFPYDAADEASAGGSGGGEGRGGARRGVLSSTISIDEAPSPRIEAALRLLFAWCRALLDDGSTMYEPSPTNTPGPSASAVPGSPSPANLAPRVRQFLELQSLVEGRSRIEHALAKMPVSDAYQNGPQAVSSASAISTAEDSAENSPRDNTNILSSLLAIVLDPSPISDAAQSSSSFLPLHNARAPAHLAILHDVYADLMHESFFAGLLGLNGVKSGSALLALPPAESGAGRNVEQLDVIEQAVVDGTGPQVQEPLDDGYTNHFTPLHPSQTRPGLKALLSVHRQHAFTSLAVACETLVERIISSGTRASPLVFHSDFLLHIVNLDLWSSAISLLQAAEAGLLIFTRCGTYLTGAPGVLLEMRLLPFLSLSLGSADGGTQLFDDWRSIDVFSLQEVSCLHYAVQRGQSDFISLFFRVFPEHSVDAFSILAFSRSVGGERGYQGLCKVLALAARIELPSTKEMSGLYEESGVSALGLSVHGVRQSRLKLVRRASDGGGLDTSEGGVPGSQLLSIMPSLRKLRPTPDYILLQAATLERIMLQALASAVRLGSSTLTSSGEITQGYVNSQHVGPGGGSSSGYAALKPQFGGPLQGLCFSKQNQNQGLSRVRNVESAADEAIALLGQASDEEVVLMDGSTTPLHTLARAASYLLRAVPLPLLSTGVGHSGHTILHAVSDFGSSSTGEGGGSSGSGGNLYASVDIGNRPAGSSAFNFGIDTNSAEGEQEKMCRAMLQGGAWRCVAVDAAGTTPIYLALSTGRFALAKSMLSLTLNRHPGVPVVQLYENHSSVALPNRAPALLHKLAVSRLRCAEDLFYGLRHRGKSLATCSSLLDLLVWSMSACEAQWRQIVGQDFTHFVQLSYGSGGAAAVAAGVGAGEGAAKGSGLDSISRAGQVLTMMGIPFSALLGAGAGASQSGQTPLSDARVRLFTDLSPRTLRSSLSLPTALRLRTLLSGFLQLRNPHPSAADYLNSLLIVRRGLHCSFYDIGMSGQDLELYSRAAMHRRLRYAIAWRIPFAGLYYGQESAPDVGNSVDATNANASGPFVPTGGSSGSSGVYEGFGMGEEKDADKENEEESSFVPGSAFTRRFLRQIIIESRTEGQYAPTEIDPDPSGERFLTSPRKGLYPPSLPILPPLPAEKAFSAYSTTALDSWGQAQAPRVLQALKLSYMLLDWARLLYLTRTLVSMTQEGGANTNETEAAAAAAGAASGAISYSPTRSAVQAGIHHPLDSLRAELAAAQVHEEHVSRYCRAMGIHTTLTSNSMPDADPNTSITIAGASGNYLNTSNPSINTILSSLPGGAAPSSAANPLPTRLCICDNLSPAELLLLLQPRASAAASSAGPAALSGQFHEARRLVLEGLASLLLGLGFPQLCDFVCRLGRDGIISSAVAASKESDSAASTPAPPSAPVLGVTRLQAQKGISALLVCLQRLTVKDVLEVSKGREYMDDLGKTSDTLRVVIGGGSGVGGVGGSLATERSDDGGLQPSVAEIAAIDQINGDASASSSSAKSAGDAHRYRRAVLAENMKSDLIASYSALNSVSFLLLAVAGIHRNSSFYRVSAVDWARLARGFSPLNAALLPSHLLSSLLQRPRRQTHRPHALTLFLQACQAHTAGRSLQCCLDLLQLGVDPTAQDVTGRCPIVLAAVLGRVDVLRACLEYSTDAQLQRIAEYRTLLWHVLMAAPASTGSLDSSSGTWLPSARCEDLPPHELCVRLLLARGFPIDTPIYSAFESTAATSTGLATTPTRPTKILQGGTGGVGSAGASASGAKGGVVARMHCLDICVLKGMWAIATLLCEKMNAPGARGNSQEGVTAGGGLGSVNGSVYRSFQASSISQSSAQNSIFSGLPQKPAKPTKPPRAGAVSGSASQEEDRGKIESAKIPAPLDIASNGSLVASHFGALHWALLSPHVGMVTLVALYDTLSKQSVTTAESGAASPQLAVRLDHLLPHGWEGDLNHHVRFMSDMCRDPVNNEPPAGAPAISSSNAYLAQLLLNSTQDSLAAGVELFFPSSKRRSNCPLWSAVTRQGGLLDTLKPRGKYRAKSPVVGDVGEKGLGLGLGLGMAASASARKASQTARVNAKSSATLHTNVTTLFALGLAGRRIDVTAFLFRKLRLYADGTYVPDPPSSQSITIAARPPSLSTAPSLTRNIGGIGASAGSSFSLPSSSYVKYPSPLELLQLGSYYDFPEGMAAVLLYRDSTGGNDGNSAGQEGVSVGALPSSTAQLLSSALPFGPFLPVLPAPLSPLHIACISGASESIRYLLTAGATVSFSLLLQCLRSRRVKEADLAAMLQQYLQARRGEENETTLNTPIDVLEAAEAGSKAEDVHSTRPPPHALPKTREPNSYLAAGASADAMATDTAAVDAERLIHLLCRCHLPLCLSIVLEHGASSNLRDARGFLPIHLSVGFGAGRCTKVLSLSAAIDLDEAAAKGLVRTSMLRKGTRVKSELELQEEEQNGEGGDTEAQRTAWLERRRGKETVLLKRGFGLLCAHVRMFLLRRRRVQRHGLSDGSESPSKGKTPPAASSIDASPGAVRALLHFERARESLSEDA